MTQFTVHITKQDARCKSGARTVAYYDAEHTSASELEAAVRNKHSNKHEIEVRETWVQRRNWMSGNTYWERFDTPRACSPATEAYWTM